MRCRNITVVIIAVLAIPILLRHSPQLLADLDGQVCVVTGASRGIGKGIAIGLGEAKCTVYITGRSLKSGAKNQGGPGQKHQAGSLEDTCKLVEEAGGKCIASQVDSADDEALKAFFAKVEQEQGRLDVLVNNAFAGVSYLPTAIGRPFWELDPVEAWDWINNVGLRSHYIASTYATRIMNKKKKGLIVNLSSFGGLDYIFNVAYGIGKSGMDRMANDMAIELATEEITMVSLWPGLVKTENIKDDALASNKLQPRRGLQPGIPPVEFEKLLQTPCAETPLFSGRAVAHMARDQARAHFTGRVVSSGGLAALYGFVDERGVRSPVMTSLKFILSSQVFTSLLKSYDMWEVADQPKLDITWQMDFFWNQLPSFAFPGFLVKLASGAPNFFV